MKNSQAKAYNFPKGITQKSAARKKLDAEFDAETLNLETDAGKNDFKEYFRRRLIEDSKPVKRGLAEFLCNKASLQNVSKMAEAMAMDKSEKTANREEAQRVKFSIENALAANTTAHAAQLAFIAGLRWMQIYWAKSLDSQGRPIKGLWKDAEQIFKSNHKISARRLYLELKSPGNFDSFKRTLNRKRKVWAK